MAPNLLSHDPTRQSISMLPGFFLSFLSSAAVSPVDGFAPMKSSRESVCTSPGKDCKLCAACPLWQPLVTRGCKNLKLNNLKSNENFRSLVPPARKVIKSRTCLVATPLASSVRGRSHPIEGPPAALPQVLSDEPTLCRHRSLC